MIDLACSIALLAAFSAIASAYHLRRARLGPTRFDRVEKAGPSPLLGKGTMEMAYSFVEPVARACVRQGISANTITGLSLAGSAVAGAALALGHLGVGAALAALSALGDALDGAVAREEGSASPAGELLDASVDRYAETFFLGGLALHYRGSAPALALCLAAIVGSFMVSYGTAKAEALSVPAPRGSLRRAERAVYLCAGALASPIAEALGVRFGLPAWTFDAPMLAALALVGVGANVSAVRRLLQISAELSGTRQPRAPAPWWRLRSGEKR